MVLGLTIAWLYMPTSEVGPSGVTETAPAVTDGNPAGSSPVATPSEAAPTSGPSNGPAVAPQPASPRAPAPACRDPVTSGSHKYAKRSGAAPHDGTTPLVGAAAPIAAERPGADSSGAAARAGER